MSTCRIWNGLKYDISRDSETPISEYRLQLQLTRVPWGSVLIGMGDRMVVASSLYRFSVCKVAQ
jgi:hypothetical protein